jgi:DNA-binding NtrC family response regulator
MARLWIVHREDRQRTALVRLASPAEDAVVGAPADPGFESAAPAEVVVLGLGEGWEEELQFAHAASRRLHDARWILVGPRGHRTEALRCFDTLAAEYLDYPPTVDTLRRHIRAPAARPATLSERARREAVTTRFSRWFADLELPEVLRALDPRMADVPLLIRGEAGTGRGVLARYVHAYGGSASGPLVHVPCLTTTTADEIARSIAAARAGGSAPVTVWLEDLERLPEATQHALRSRIELGASGPAVARWIATTLPADDPTQAAPELLRALAGISVSLPPLRERPQLIVPVASETAREWSAAHGARPRRFGEDALAVLEEYPWPGNLRELEALVEQTLGAGSADPIRADDLQSGGQAFAPLAASELGELLPDAPPETGEPESEVAPSPDELATLVDALSEPSTAPDAAALEAALDGGGDAADRSLRGGLPRLATALSHEVRNPLATIRTFAGLLPKRYDDPEFRTRFAELVEEDVDRIDSAVERLERLARLESPRTQRVDVSSLLEELLEERQDEIRRRRLLVLKELDTSRPHATGDAEQLRFVFDALLDRALRQVPERGDLYLASRHHPAGPSEPATVRVLLRYHGVGDQEGRSVPLSETSLDWVVADLVVGALGGQLNLARTDGDEAVIVVDLPAP